MTSALPIIKYNQVTLSQLRSQRPTQEKWAQQQQQLRRFQLNFPDLSDSFAPDWAALPQARKNLHTFNDNRGGLSPHTLKMLALTLRKWDSYCKAEGIYSFPIAPSILLGWFQGLKLIGMKINTLKQYRAQLSLFHAVMAVDDVTKQMALKHFFQALAKDEMALTGSQVIELQAKPFRKRHLDALMQLWQDPQQALTYRDLTVLMVAYGTLLREGEVGRIRKKHVQFIENGDINIERVTSKTSISPEPKRLTGRFSATLRHYLVTYCAELAVEDFIFCWLSGTGKRPIKYRKTPMSGMTMDRIYQRAHRALGLNKDDHSANRSQRAVWSGHSSRIGALQDGYLVGMSLTQLIQLGDWKSDAMVLRYLRGLSNAQSPNVLLQD